MNKELKTLVDQWEAKNADKTSMPIYRYVCHACKIEEKKLLKREDAEKFSGACKVCGQPLSLVIGIPEAQAMETADDYRGKSVISDVEKKLDDRAREHFNKHDLPRMVADKGVEWCKKQGFLDADGKPK